MFVVRVYKTAVLFFFFFDHFFLAKQVATLIAVYANWSFAAIEGIGWGWAGVIWLYNIVFYIPLDIIKFLIRYALSGRAWDLVIEQRVMYISKILDSICGHICDYIFVPYRLHSLGRRILGKNKGSYNGRMHRGLYMACKHQMLRCSQSEPISTSFLKWLKKLREEQRSLGTRLIGSLFLL